MSLVTREEALVWVGKHIYAVRKDGVVVTGKLAGVRGGQLLLEHDSAKKVRTKAILPLALFDVLAIGTAPFAYGFGPYGYGGFGPFFW